jgi:hypothetical protein
VGACRTLRVSRASTLVGACRALRVSRASTLAAAAAACISLLCGCKPKANQTQCDLLLDRYARLVVAEKYPDATDALYGAERERERAEARGDDAFKNCTSEVSRAEFECAMRAQSADALEKCLE